MKTDAIAGLATKAGTLVLAAATFASTRSAVGPATIRPSVRPSVRPVTGSLSNVAVERVARK